MTQPTSRPGDGRDGQDEAELAAASVDRHPAVDEPGVDDEEQVLRDLYGPPDTYGIYRGTGA